MQKLRETKLKDVSYQPNIGGRPACRRGRQATWTAAICGISLDQLHIHIAWLCFLVFCDLICDWPTELDIDTGSTLTAPAVVTHPGPSPTPLSPAVGFGNLLTLPSASDLSSILFFPLHYSSSSILTACSDLLLLQRQKCLGVLCVKFSSRTHQTFSPVL